MVPSGGPRQLVNLNFSETKFSRKFYVTNQRLYKLMRTLGVQPLEALTEVRGHVDRTEAYIVLYVMIIKSCIDILLHTLSP